jgi:3-methyl-2-oxobutanoate hydroxymethyltransferase
MKDLKLIACQQSVDFGFELSGARFHSPGELNANTEKAAALKARKGGRAIACLTAYDYPMARLLDEAGADLLLVGDSLGMVVLGFPDTTHVTLGHMIHHTAAVARAKPQALVVGDLPIGTYPDAATALIHARRLVDAGAEAVKLEGGVRQADKVRAIVADGIPVLGHLGMLPQRVLEEGGYHRKGRTPEQVEALHEGARALAAAGVFGVVLESVVGEVAREITVALEIPTIGIGCGEGNCDGEIAVVTDVVGSFPWFVPPFATPLADVAGLTREAARQWVGRVMEGS